MSTFFQQTAQAMIAKHIDRFPLLNLKAMCLNLLKAANRLSVPVTA